MDGGKKGPSIFFVFTYINKKNVLIPKMMLKLSTAFLSEVMSILNFKMRKFESNFRLGKWLTKLNDRKGVSAPQKS